MDYLQIANSLPMWVAAGIAILLALSQAFIFAKNPMLQVRKLG